MQLDLPIVIGEPIPILYVQMDGTGVPGGEERKPWAGKAKRKETSPYPRGQVGMRVHPNHLG